MSTITVVPTVESSNDPPRIRLDITDTGTPALFEANVARLNPDGSVTQVRTFDGNPVTLTTSGANRVGLAYDYEMPYGQPVSYSTIESPTVVSAQVTVDETRVWLVHPGVPSLSLSVELRAGTWAEEEVPVQRGVFYPMGRANPVVQTSGVRSGSRSTIIVALESLAELNAIRELVADAGTLLLNVPATMNLGIDTCYVAVGDVSIRRPSDIGTDPHRDVVLPCTVVDRPSGGSQAERVYTDLLDYASYTSLKSAYDSYLSLLGGP